MRRCQIRTDTKPIAICSEILPFLWTDTLPHMHVQLHLNFSSRAFLLKSCCVSCSKINCAQFCSLGPELFFRIGRPFIFISKTDTVWESTSLIWDVARCQNQTDIKPIAICSEILPFLCTYLYTPTHAHSAPLELFLQSIAKELLCVIQQIQLFSVLQFGTMIVLLDRLAF